MLRLTDKLWIMWRHEWDDSGAPHPRRGRIVPLSERTKSVMHHDVMVDSDSTRNIWEWVDEEVAPHMRRLRTIDVPRLGADVPYNWVGFFMDNGMMVVAEGRGNMRSGAHMEGHNRSAMALGMAGDFHNYAININRWIPSINHFWGWLKYDVGMSNLPDTVTGHGLVQGQSTLCPGTYIIRKLGQMRPTRLEVSMNPILVIFFDAEEPHGTYYLGDWIEKRRLVNKAELDLFRWLRITEVGLDKVFLDAIKTIE